MRKKLKEYDIVNKCLTEEFFKTMSIDDLNIIIAENEVYSDSNNNQFKTGVGNRTPGKGGASSLFKFLLQMRQVWAIQTMSVDEIYEKLPTHFDRFK